MSLYTPSQLGSNTSSPPTVCGQCVKFSPRVPDCGACTARRGSRQNEKSCRAARGACRNGLRRCFTLSVDGYTGSRGCLALTHFHDVLKKQRTARQPTVSSPVSPLSFFCHLSGSSVLFTLNPDMLGNCFLSLVFSGLKRLILSKDKRRGGRMDTHLPL